MNSEIHDKKCSMILLDDVQSTMTNRSSRLYQNPIRYWCVEEHGNLTTHDLKVCLAEIQAALAAGQYIVAVFSYEIGIYLNRFNSKFKYERGLDRHPLIQAWSFSSYESLAKNQVDEFLGKKIQNLEQRERIVGIENLQSSVTKEQYTSDIEKIQEYLRTGDSYQINYTYRMTGHIYGSEIVLYSKLREHQPSRFGALIQDDRCNVLSFSPELFIQRRGNLLKTKPMKGTASAKTSLAEDLQHDPKNRSENIMIVDLLRNDLNRIALPGTVHVPRLFDVARYGDVLQMTSTVQAKVNEHLDLFDLFQGIFPAGSITGAPKRRSMEIIEELEETSRGYYCGALGWLDPNQNFTLSVPIRTLEIDREQTKKKSSFTMGIGSGITVDSQSNQEWEECLLKASFLQKLQSAVGLFETMRVEKASPLNLDLHLNRMKNSAKSLGISFDDLNAKKMVMHTCMNLRSDLVYRLKLELDRYGVMNVQSQELGLIEKKVKVFWASELLSEKESKVYSGNVLLKHKTTHRQLYDDAWRLSVAKGGFDALFVNEEGFVTEGGRSNIFIKPNGMNTWLTPPVHAGLLPGIMRSMLLNDERWCAKESNIRVEDVLSAKEVVLTNALRGVIPASIG